MDIDTVNIKNTAGEFKLKVQTEKDEDGDSYVAHTTVEGYEDAPIMDTLPKTIVEDCTRLTASRKINTLGINDKEYIFSDYTEFDSWTFDCIKAFEKITSKIKEEDFLILLQ